MGDKSGIQWTDATWNPIRGCSIVSPGCTNCYAMKQAHRMNHAATPGRPREGAYYGLTKMSSGGPVWTGEVREVPELVELPLRWRKPRRIFVNSMSDLFHESVSIDFIVKVWEVMAATPQHTYQILTKRAGRMRGLVGEMEQTWMHGGTRFRRDGSPIPWPLPNVWIGVSVEDQKRAEERIPDLLQTPAAVRFVSAEPLLGPLKFHPLNVRDSKYGMDRAAGIYALRGVYQLPDCHSSEPHPKLDWVIVGGESGPRARPCEVEWIREIVRQCKAAKVPCFVKQLGKWVRGPNKSRVSLTARKGEDPDEWPEDLRVREFPLP